MTGRIAVLTDLESVRSLLVGADPEGRLVSCDLRELIVGSDVLGRVVEVVASVVPVETLQGERRRVAVLVDETPIVRYTATGESQNVKDEVERLLGEDSDVTRVTLSDGHPELHVTASVIEDARRASTNAHAVVAVGGGTISDIGKMVGAAIPGLPVISVMTAASVDGYTDNVSVTLRDGVKRTVPSVWPDAVIADAETVAGAPSRMNRAGYGEMTSMYVAPADWRLAAFAGIDTGFHPGPIALLDALSTGLDACASGVAAGDPEAVQELTWALALRGIATGVAGSTACLSGVEHLISHMLDLRAAQLHLPTGLHGEQVGAGSVVAACAWEMLCDRLAEQPGAVPDPTWLDAHAAQERVQGAFSSLDPTGRISDECWSDYRRKLDRMTSAVPVIESLLADWPVAEAELRDLFRPSGTIAAGLRAAGAPVLMTELGEDVDPATARWAIENCALMRDRFTVVDLLTILGWWQPSDVDEIEMRVAAATAQAGAQA